MNDLHRLGRIAAQFMAAECGASKRLRGLCRKTCPSVSEAERYQGYLYGRHNSVRLVESPQFSEQGLYVWEVMD